jgi:hypothetical protein
MRSLQYIARRDAARKFRAYQARRYTTPRYRPSCFRTCCATGLSRLRVSMSTMGDLRPAIAPNGQETSASTTVTNARQHAHARPAHERAPSLSQLLSTIPPSIRSKPTSDLVQITRLEMCLSDFFNYLVGIENIAKNIDGLHAQSALDTRMSIATLQERISSIKHSMTNPWSTNSQNLRWM